MSRSRSPFWSRPLRWRPLRCDRTGSGRAARVRALRAALGRGALAAAVLACTPRVAIEAPREPIVINLNVKIEHEIRVKVDQDLEEEFRKNGDIY